MNTYYIYYDQEFIDEALSNLGIKEFMDQCIKKYPNATSLKVSVDIDSLTYTLEVRVHSNYE